MLDHYAIPFFISSYTMIKSYFQDVYAATIAPMIDGVIHGLNATIFAYGSTGRYLCYLALSTISFENNLKLCDRNIN